MHGVGSRNKLQASKVGLYPTESTLDVLGRALCSVGCLPRKELHEAWEMAVRVREHFRGGRVVDLCAGYGVLAQVMLLLDEDSTTEALAVDVRIAPNHVKVNAAITRAFPSLRDRVRFVHGRLDRVTLGVDDIVVSSHACGALTDDVLAHAIDAGARVAVLPCCHAYRYRTDLASASDPALAMDTERVARVIDLGYRAWIEAIPVEVSPKNRILFGAPGLQLRDA